MPPALIPLDILAQQPRLNRLYTQITFFFPLNHNNPTSTSQFIATLERACKQLSNHFPWTSGTVINDCGIFKIDISSSSKISLVVKDYRNGPGTNDSTGTSQIPSYPTLHHAKFPFRYLDESLLAPIQTFSDFGAGLPVFVVQVSFVDGGLLLTFNGQHGAMDMAGLGSVIGLFAKACRDQIFTEAEIKVGNMDRVGCGVSVPLSNIQQPTSSTSSSTSDPKPEPDLVWAYFSFSSSCLAGLKSQAVRSLPPEQESASGRPRFISTDDALSAFIWQSMTCARVRDDDKDRLQSSSTLSRNVDVRGHFSLPGTCPGFLTSATSHTFSAEEVLQMPLGGIALCLREALDPGSLKEKTLSQAMSIRQSLNSRPSSSNQPAPKPNFNPSLDVRLSSWAKEPLSELDFGTLGKPETTRRPAFRAGAREGLVYFLPKEVDGSIVVGVCLKKVDMERLKENKQVKSFGDFIG